MNRFFMVSLNCTLATILLIILYHGSMLSPLLTQTSDKGKEVLFPTLNNQFYVENIVSGSYFINNFRIIKSQSIRYQFDKPYPFGAKILMSHRFPSESFWVSKNPMLNNQLVIDHQKALYNAWIYYLQLIPISGNDEVNQKFLPKIDKFDLVPLGKEEKFHFHTERFSDPTISRTFIWQLPKIGKYNVYYYTESDNQQGCFEPYQNDFHDKCCIFDKFACNAIGTLIFYDRKELCAKFIKVHYIDSENNALNYRFFYITKHRKIHIFEGYGDVKSIADNESLRDSASFFLKEAYEISILNNGDFIIDEK